MRRTLTARLFTGLWAVWLGIAIVEPAAVHTCQVHGNAASGHQHAMAGAEHQHHQMPQQSKPAPCSCIGECSAAQAVAAPTFASVEVAVAENATSTVVISVADDIAPASEPRHARPFATAPPA